MWASEASIQAGIRTEACKATSEMGQKDRRPPNTRAGHEIHPRRTVVTPHAPRQVAGPHDAEPPTPHGDCGHGTAHGFVLVRRTGVGALPDEEDASMAVSVAPTGDRFLDAGRPVFLLGDTVWAAFSRISLPEWESYLEFRRRQGFNVVYISVLPIVHDTSQAAEDRQPFHVDDAGRWDLDAPDGSYFRHARRMVEVAAASGITAALVVLWCNYVPGGAWGTGVTVLDDAQTRAYVDLVAAEFGPYHPILVVSGDDSFDDLETMQRYAAALSRLKAAVPGCLTTLHSRPDTLMPVDLADDPHLDFYAYQSGHDHDNQSLAWRLADHYRAQRRRLPVVNMEPCYEGSGYHAGAGRFRAEDVRYASWASILAGASAGLGYGAQGVFSWHRRGDEFTGEHFSGTPFPADVALGFGGAADVCLARHLVEDHGLYAVEPRQDLLGPTASSVRVAATEDLTRVVVYARHPFAVELAHDLAGYDAQLLDLAGRTRLHPRLRARGGKTILEQPDVLGDVLYLFAS